MIPWPWLGPSFLALSLAALGLGVIRRAGCFVAGPFGRSALRQAKRALVLIAGSTILLVGVLLLVLPGPGVLSILLGLSVLALEFVWARHLLARTRASVEGIRVVVRRRLRRP